MEYEDASDLTNGVLGLNPKQNIVRAIYFCFECGAYWVWEPFSGIEKWSPFDVMSAASDERTNAETVNDTLKDMARIHITREIRAELDEKTEEVVA
jgi:hypothetical protein